MAQGCPPVSSPLPLFPPLKVPADSTPTTFTWTPPQLRLKFQVSPHLQLANIVRCATAAWRTCSLDSPTGRCLCSMQCRCSSRELASRKRRRLGRRRCSQAARGQNQGSPSASCVILVVLTAADRHHAQNSHEGKSNDQSSLVASTSLDNPQRGYGLGIQAFPLYGECKPDAPILF